MNSTDAFWFAVPSSTPTSVEKSLEVVFDLEVRARANTAFVTAAAERQRSAVERAVDLDSSSAHPGTQRCQGGQRNRLRQQRLDRKFQLCFSFARGAVFPNG